MANKSTAEKIQEALRDDRGAQPTPYDEALRKLRELAEAIERSLSPGTIRVRLETGYRVGLGQQYKLVLSVPSQSFSDVLLRAYIPVDGYPVTLDLFDDEHPSCADADAVEAAIVQFLQHRDVKQRLLALKDLAAA